MKRSYEMMTAASQMETELTNPNLALAKQKEMTDMLDSTRNMTSNTAILSPTKNASRHDVGD